jgi:hypothetical protein
MPLFTQNANFAIEGDKLYRRALHPAVVRNHSDDLSDTPDFTLPSGASEQFVHLVSKGKYFQDCLVTAEDLVNDLYPNTVAGTDGIRSHAAATGEDFGDGHDKNIALAKKIAKNHPLQANRNAAPVVGQAYVILSPYKTAPYPYHAAGVIAQDGNSRVTLEVFAGRVDASSRSFDGNYRIYSVSPGSGATFHDVWSPNAVFRSGTGSTLQPPIAIVIQP